MINDLIEPRPCKISKVVSNGSPAKSKNIKH